ncbi:MAG: WxcM-like domain-containing protein [Myxococcales bacterium]|nr:WxcM-like domain-containing protein [Myxococcales bacterium]
MSVHAPQPNADAAIASGVAGCRLVDIRTHLDGRGGLAFIEGQTDVFPDVEPDVPFTVQRVYYAWGMEPDSARGMHAHRALEQVYIAINGSFDVLLEDGTTSRVVSLDNPAKGLYLGHMVWRRLYNFTPGVVCLVLASAPYDEDDYFRDKDAFMQEARAQLTMEGL